MNNVDMLLIIYGWILKERARLQMDERRGGIERTRVPLAVGARFAGFRKNDLRSWLKCALAELRCWLKVGNWVDRLPCGCFSAS